MSTANKPEQLHTPNTHQKPLADTKLAAVLRRVITAVVRFLFDLLSTREVIGFENVPREDGCILAMNHLARLDPALIYVVLEDLNRPDMTALIADSYKKFPPFRLIVDLFGGIWINRQGSDFKAIREAQQFVNHGGLLGLAPEGTRSKSKVLITGKTGVAFLVYKLGVPLVPIATTGTEKSVEELLRLRRPHFRIQFGEPIMLPPLDPQNRSASLRRNTDEIMCHIAVMLPPEFRGDYADHPRLHELLAARDQKNVSP